MNIHSPVRRKATNVSLDADLIALAKKHGVNISRACERGLAAELKAVREAQWQKDNAEAIRSSNEWVEKNGLPLARYRMF